MIGYYKEHMLVQTCIDLDTQVSNLTRRISLDRFIEIGDDRNLVQEIENALLRMYSRVKSIEPYFDLDITSLNKANTYFALVKDVNDALKYVREVRRKDYGSREHTYELLERLGNCKESIYAIGDLVSMNTDMVH
jgi:hypothetical protein